MLIKAKIKVKSPIVNRLSHSSVINESGAHFCFQGPEPAVCHRSLPAVWDHTVLLAIDTGEPVPALYMGGGPDFRILLP